MNRKWPVGIWRSLLVASTLLLSKCARGAQGEAKAAQWMMAS